MKKKFSLKWWDEVEDSDQLHAKEIEIDIPFWSEDDDFAGNVISDELNKIHQLHDIKVVHVRRQGPYYVIQQDLGGGRLGVIIAYDCTE